MTFNCFSLLIALQMLLLLL